MISLSLRRGVEYEKRVCRYLKRQLRLGRLPLPSLYTTIHRQKNYPTICGTKVNVDVALETFRPDSAQRSLLTIVECKCLRRGASTLHVNDLITKMRLLNAHKGIMAVNMYPMEGVMAQARYYGIGVVLIPVDSENVKWLAE
ncbi:MAG: hypothetical protein HDS70_07700 [Bacteroidales bacterium]|nr:hypothetical protein [Bacteroidales bacterium]